MNTAMKMVLLFSQTPQQEDKKKKCIAACQNCFAECELALQYINQNPDGFTPELINLLRDCISFTKLMVDFLERNSAFLKAVCEVGKAICEKCQEETGNYPDVKELKQAAHACEQCVNACNAYVS